MSALIGFILLLMGVVFIFDLISSIFPFIIIGFVILIILGLLAKLYEEHKITRENTALVDVYSLIINDTWAVTRLKDYCYESVAEELNNHRGHIYTPRGQYRQSYLNKVNRKFDFLKECCFVDSKSSQDFCEYVTSNVFEFSRQDFIPAVIHFIKKYFPDGYEDHSDIWTVAEFFENRSFIKQARTPVTLVMG